jgi:hypothetical protein
MSEMLNNSCILIGLPQSGKTTFLAALWHVVESGEVVGSIKISSQPEDREYLNGLRDTWLKCEPLERTKAESMKEITFAAINDTGGALGSFTVPDVSGEMYKMQFESRKISQEFFDLASQATGVVLFVDPDTIKSPVLISSVPLVFRNAGGSPNSSPETGDIWKHESAPTQVVLVDLLQVLHSKINRPIKVSVVISAWDLISNSTDKEINSLSPSEWLAKQLPLLDQFLRSNETLFSHSVCGVSAQGSKYEGDNRKLHSFTKPSERIRVNFNGQDSNDITIPLKWILNEQI